MSESFPSLSLLVALPVIGALVAHRIRDAVRARWVAVGFALATLVLASCIALALHDAAHPALVELAAPIPGLGARWHLGVDGLGAPFLPLAALIASAVLIAAPPSARKHGAASQILLALSATLGVYCSLDLVLLAMFWVASLVPGAVQLHRSREPHTRERLARTYDVFLVLGSVPMIAAVLVIGWARTRAGVALPFDLTGVAGNEVPVESQQWVFVLIALAVLIRTAITPFHSWLPVLIARGPVGVAAMIAGTHLGAFLLARVAIPLLPQAASTALPILAMLALASALYAAFVALSQTDVRRALGFVITSQLALVLVGLAEANTDSVHGAMLQMLAVGLTAPGLVLVAAALEARAGTTAVARFGGLAVRMPRMAAAFLLLGLAAIGLPGSLQFVAEDLLMHGLLPTHPIVAALLLVVAVLDGITLLRLFLQIFYGPVRDAGVLGPGVVDLLPRESLALATLLTLVVLAGLAPGALLAIRADTVRTLTLDAPVHSTTAASSAH